MEENKLHSYSWNRHRQTFFNTVFKLREEGNFCDVTLACGGRMFPAHRLILAMCSDFFNEILTKVPYQQPMVMLVPVVAAADLEALLAYIYKGEIQISEANIPSFMNAAQILKIKGLYDAINESPMDQFVCAEQGQTSAQRDVSYIETEDSNSSTISATSTSLYCTEEMQQKLLPSPHSKKIVHAFPQVEVIINTEEETHDMLYEGAGMEQDEDDDDDDDDAIKREWMKEEELDPLSVPLLPDCPLTFSAPDARRQALTDSPQTSLQEVFFSEDSTSAALPAASSNFRYTKEQRRRIVRDYHIFGPVKAARLMSQSLGRKVNESSIRSVVRRWQRDQREQRAYFETHHI